VDPLSVRTMPLSTIPCLDVGEESDSVAGSDIQADDSAPVFSLRWCRTYDGSMALFDSPDRCAVIGCLTFSFPYVTVRGLSFCTEVLRVCSTMGFLPSLVLLYHFSAPKMMRLEEVTMGCNHLVVTHVTWTTWHLGHFFPCEGCFPPVLLQ
jgi:hypothetical protein